jgi:hypothetical protein
MWFPLHVVVLLLRKYKTDYNYKAFKTKTHSCPVRIVNIYQPNVKSIVRGKDKTKVEFGDKINISNVYRINQIRTKCSDTSAKPNYTFRPISENGKNEF